MRTTKINMTPKKSQQILDKHNDNNRHIRDSHVASLASEMKSGNWRLNGETIIFDENGQLMDGQHRLAAVVKSGKTIEMLVVRGVEREAMRTIDRGKSRSLADVIGLAGYPYSTALASAYRQIHLYKKRGGFTLANLKSSLSTTKALKYIKNNPDMVEAIELYKAVPQNAMIGRGVFVTLHHLLPQERYATLNKFYNRAQLGIGITSASCPTSVFREKLMRMKIERDPLGAQKVMYLTAAYYNAFAQGKKMRSALKSLPEKIILEQ